MNRYLVLVLALALTGAPLQAAADQDTSAETRADVRAKLQHELDEYERKGDSLEEQVASMIGKKKQGAEEALEAYGNRLAAAKDDLAQLDDEPSPTWDALRRKAEEDLEALRDAVDSLERTVAQR